uniref:Venom peptide Pp20a n=1 Tax=Pristhesancus plagipennis TaxID=1955184 RepID=A0A2K8JLI9_PRIPG|nr:venom peptide Pp20a [Pristhesancus plagipennis]
MKSLLILTIVALFLVHQTCASRSGDLPDDIDRIKPIAMASAGYLFPCVQMLLISVIFVLYSIFN